MHEIPSETINTPKRTRIGRSLLGIGLAVLLASATFVSGLHIGKQFPAEASLGQLFARENTAPDDSVDLSSFWHVWNLMDEKFVSSTSTTTDTKEQRLFGAIDGLVRSYNDPYTVFMPPVEASSFEDDIAGNFSGVGMEVGMRNDVVTVIAPLPDSPAEKAGIIAGDTIVRIDDTSTERMGVDEAVKRIRGEKGTTVTLTIFREGEEEFQEFTLTRDTIKVPTAKTEIKGDVFIISLYSFNALSEAEMQYALRSYVESGKKKLILDLRGNPGGYLESAVAIASHFLPMGKVVVRENYGEGISEDVFRSTGKTLGEHMPEKMVVLVDGGSASAAEILAGALKEHGVATLIGMKTFGKGSVQELIPLEDGSSLKITIGHWLTPNGTSLTAGGLAPDIEINRTPEDRVAEKDPQLDEAIRFLGE